MRMARLFPVGFPAGVHPVPSRPLIAGKAPIFLAARLRLTKWLFHSPTFGYGSIKPGLEDRIQP